MRRAARPLLLLALLAPIGSSALTAQTPPPPGAKPPGVTYPTKDRFGKPLPSLTFYCQYVGQVKDESGKYPLYQNDLVTMATYQGAVQNAWRSYIEETYHPASAGNAVCSIIPDDPAQKEAALKSFNFLTQPASQVVVKTSWKP